MIEIILASDEYLIHRVKFYLVLSLQIPAIVLFLCIFAFFITNRIHLRKLQNQALIVLFIVNFIQLTLNIPLLLHFLRLNRISPAKSTYCKFWMFVEYTLDAINEFLVAIMCIQRHTLVFRPNLFHIRSKLYLFYYLPLLLGFIYPVGFYMGSVIFYPCDNTQWNFTLNMCGDTICYLSSDLRLALYDWTVNSGLPIVVIILANIVLVIRVIRQKSRRQRVVTWSKQRRMTLQLLGISSLYLTTWLPSIIAGSLQQVNPSIHLYEIEEDYISDLPYLICLLLPWICIGMLPDFNKWMLKHFHRLKRPLNTVGTTAVGTIVR
jgi:hypothetical protein